MFFLESQAFMEWIKHFLHYIISFFFISQQPRKEPFIKKDLLFPSLLYSSSDDVAGFRRVFNFAR